MPTIRVVWTRGVEIPPDFIPPTKFHNDKGHKIYHHPVLTKEGRYECLVDDNIFNREYIECAKHWSITEEDVIQRRVKIAPQPLPPIIKTRYQMQQEMDDAGIDYGNGALLSDKRMEDAYKKSAIKRSKYRQTIAEYNEKIATGTLEVVEE